MIFNIILGVPKVQSPLVTVLFLAAIVHMSSYVRSAKIEPLCSGFCINTETNLGSCLL